MPNESTTSFSLQIVLSLRDIECKSPNQNAELLGDAGIEKRDLGLDTAPSNLLPHNWMHHLFSYLYCLSKALNFCQSALINLAIVLSWGG